MQSSCASPCLKRELKTLKIGPQGRVEWKGKSLINLASNDYLGLSTHPHVKERAKAFIEQYGAGAGSSRLVSGTHTYHEHLENRLALLTGYESALLMNTGYQANLTILAALGDRDTCFFLDRNCHNSLIEGAKLSGAEWHRYKHQDHDHLQKLLSKSTKKNIIVTESLFSMDGDITDLDRFNEYDALLYVDDAHATGVYGKNGLGFARGDIVIGTFGKAFGSFGAYVLSNRSVRDMLIQKCKGLIYTTALPPAIVGAIEGALDLIPSFDRKKLHTLSHHFRSQLQTKGYQTGISDSHIIPLIVGTAQAALDLESALFEAGYFAPAIRPPTVPPGQSRVRLSLTTNLDENALDPFPRLGI